jgi:hypothetical protein
MKLSRTNGAGVNMLKTDPESVVGKALRTYGNPLPQSLLPLTVFAQDVLKGYNRSWLQRRESGICD